MWSYPFSEPDRLRLHPRYAHLREHEPLARVQMPYGDPAWLVTRYADARSVLTDRRFSRAPGHDEPRTTPEVKHAGMLSMDPPEHTRMLRLAAKAFSVGQAERMRAHSTGIADSLVAAMIHDGPPADLIGAFSLPFPLTVMCELFGVPAGDRARFPTWAKVVVSADALSPAKVRAYSARLGVYMTALVRQRRRQPSDDLLGALVRARDNEDRLTEDELIRLAVDLLAMGYENVATQLSNFVYTLLTLPEAWDRLCADPDLVPAAVDELMRYVPVATFAEFPRYATSDVELAGGVVRAGEPVLVSLAAANRDGRVFADPEQLDLARDPNPHLGFSHGLHHCLGAALARMELQVGLTALARHLPKLRIAVAEPKIAWHTGMVVRGPKALPLTW